MPQEGGCPLAGGWREPPARRTGSEERFGVPSVGGRSGVTFRTTDRQKPLSTSTFGEPA